MNRILKITGTGDISVKPDLAIIRLPMVVIEQEYQQAIELLNKNVITLKATVQDVGVDPNLLKTTDFNVSRKTQWNKETEEREFIGFEASHDLVLKIPFDKDVLGKVINQISEDLYGVEFTVHFSVKKTEQYNQQLLENAILNAKKNAEIIARASEVVLKEIISIDYSFGEVRFSSKPFYGEAIMMDASDNLPDIEPENIDASKNVTVSWRIE